MHRTAPHFTAHGAMHKTLDKKRKSEVDAYLSAKSALQVLQNMVRVFFKCEKAPKSVTKCRKKLRGVFIYCAFFGAGPPTQTSAGCVPLGIALQPNTTAFVLRVLRNETNRQPWRGVVVFESEAHVPAPRAILSRAWVLSDFLTPLDFEITE